MDLLGQLSGHAGLGRDDEQVAFLWKISKKL
jgi:hypothetical protein